jgi:type III secretory pathway component EscS
MCTLIIDLGPISICPTAVWLERTQVCLIFIALLPTMNSTEGIGFILAIAYAIHRFLDASIKLGITLCHVMHDVLSEASGFMVGSSLQLQKSRHHKVHGYNITSLVCSDISSHYYCDSPDKRRGEEKKIITHNSDPR